jgi:lipid II isoglutaminyl synthase (glutamine-hydrolysing)
MATNYYVTHLYPDQMSIYGDYGNILTLKHYCERIGLNFIYQPVGIGQELPQITNLYFFGGGQDKEQMLIYPDLLSKKTKLIEDLLVKNVGMLAICGGYQALGREFITGEGDVIPGLEILPVTTSAPSSQVNGRAIGNLIVESDVFGCKLVGFENHSGQTYILDNNMDCKPIGNVLLGHGNNMTQKIEGCIYKNIVGSYMHGPMLPKNPEVTKWLITKTANLDAKQQYELQNLDTSIEKKAREQLINRFVTKN